MRPSFVLAFVAGYSQRVLGLDNGVALTPPMGWCSWERFLCTTNCSKFPGQCINESLILEQADALVSGGYLAAGYNYVNIDDCWQSGSRDARGRLQPDPIRFPHGMKWLADQIHQRGLKFGMYTDYGSYTCGGYPGSPWETQQIDAEAFAEWGIDSLKVDGCHSNVSTMNDAYPRFGRFLNKTNRQIVYSCSWPDYLETAKIPVNFTYIAENCNMWRMYRDIYAQWWIIADIIQWMGAHQAIIQPVAKPGAWNDADQLVIGDHHTWEQKRPPKVGLSVDEAVTTMAMWSIWASPLLMSNDLRNVSEADRRILLNREVIAVSQDRLGIQGTRIVDHNSTTGTHTLCTSAALCSTEIKDVVAPLVEGWEIWARPLFGGDVAVVLYNKGEQVVDIALDFKDVGAFNKSSCQRLVAHDLFSGATSVYDDSLVARSVPPHGSRMFRLATAARDASIEDPVVL